jgi:hypothetical protein
MVDFISVSFLIAQEQPFNYIKNKKAIHRYSKGIKIKTTFAKNMKR